MKSKILFFMCLMTVSCLSSSINSMFSSKSIMSLTIGTSNQLIETIGNGLQTAINSCGEAFKWNRWNCPEFEFSRRRRQDSTKEQAVIHAFMSAALVHTITKNCSKGHIQGCGCNNEFKQGLRSERSFLRQSLMNHQPASINKNYEKDWRWGGCSDNVNYGEMVAKKLLDELESGSDTQTEINLHNNKVGRLIVRESMVRRCRCHGVSGSCSLQTCWMELSPFGTTANIIRQKYQQALKIRLENKSSRSTSSAIGALSKTQEDKLIFIDESPDFCRPNNHTGWPGTKGRSCSRSREDTTTFIERRSCRNLCRHCGYNVRKVKRQVEWNCNCRFKWCCEVQCETCTKTVEEFFCQ